jgi:hypothetical protein
MKPLPSTQPAAVLLPLQQPQHRAPDRRNTTGVISASAKFILPLFQLVRTFFSQLCDPLVEHLIIDSGIDISTVAVLG